MLVRVIHSKPVGCAEGMVPPGETGSLTPAEARIAAARGFVEIINGRATQECPDSSFQTQQIELEGDGKRRCDSDHDGVSGPRREAVRGDEARSTKQSGDPRGEPQVAAAQQGSQASEAGTEHPRGGLRDGVPTLPGATDGAGQGGEDESGHADHEGTPGVGVRGIHAEVPRRKRLTQEQRQAIKASSATNKELARQYNVHAVTISRIKNS